MMPTTSVGKLPCLMVKYSVVLIGLLTAIGFVMRPLGILRLPNPALRGFIKECVDTPQPCWYGVLPGVTKIDMAQDQLGLVGYQLVETTVNDLRFSFRQSVDGQSESCSDVVLVFDKSLLTVKTILLNGCKGIVLGDLALIGCHPKSGQIYAQPRQHMFALVTQNVRLDENNHHIWLPAIRIDGVAIGNNLDVVRRYWRGLVLSWSFCLAASLSA